MYILILLFRAFAVVCVLAVVWNARTKKYLNPYKLFLVFGKKGSGKSTYLIKLAFKYLKKGWTVYTNMEECCIPGVRFFNIQHLGDYVPPNHSLLLLDEVGMIWDNRDYKLFKPQVRDFFKLQRHYKVIVYMASQSFDVDKKLRDLCDGMYLHVNKLRTWSIGKYIYKSITITESTSEAESRIAQDLVVAPFWNWTYTYIPKWSKLFDSHNVPQKPELPYSEVEGSAPNSTKFFQKPFRTYCRSKTPRDSSTK